MADVSTPTPVVDSPAPVSAPVAPSAPVSTPVSSGSTTDYDSAFDRVFAEPTAEAANADAPPPEVVTADEPEVPEPVAEPVEGETEAPVDAAAPVEEVDPYADEIKPDSVSQDGKRFFYNKGKAETLMSAHKTVQSLKALDPSFSPDSYKEMLGRTVELDRMLADLDSGEPERVGPIAADFVSQNRNPASVQAFIDTAMANTARYHPQAFQVVQNKILGGLAQQLYKQYENTKDEATKKLAQNLDYFVRKDFIDPDQQVATQDPLAAERADIARREQAYQQRLNADRQALITAHVTAANSAADSAVDKAIETALAIIPANVREMKPVEMKHAARDLREQFDTITKANPNYQKQYQILLSRLKTNPSDQSKAALVNWVQQWADYAVGKSKGAVVGRFTNAVTTASAADHAKQQEIAKRREPGTGATPVQRATVQQKLKDPKLSYDEKFKLVFG